MSFPSDTSTQLNYTTVSYLPTYSSITNPSILFNDGTSGIYNSTANSIIIYTSSTTALTIDSNQCLYGNATGLTHLQYTNIDGKPTNFQSDWNSTIINKPTNFQSDYNSTVINTPNLSVYATNTNLNSLSTNATLSINNLNSTSTTILGIVNGHTTSISNLNATSTTILGNLNSLSTQSYLDTGSGSMLVGCRVHFFQKGILNHLKKVWGRHPFAYFPSHSPRYSEHLK